MLDSPAVEPLELVPSDEAFATLAAVTAWRDGDRATALDLLEKVGVRAVHPLFGLYVGLLELVEDRGVDTDEFLQGVALRMRRFAEGLEDW